MLMREWINSSVFTELADVFHRRKTEYVLTLLLLRLLQMHTSKLGDAQLTVLYYSDVLYSYVLA